MDRRRMILLILMLVLVPVIFLQLRNLGTPAPQVQAPVQQTVQPVVPQVEYSDVLVAAADISLGTKLSEVHLSWRQWPTEVVSASYITKSMRPQAITELAGGVARAEFMAGDPITERKIVMPGEKSVMAALLTPGMRAVTTRISVDTAAGGFIQPGDHVDIILTSSVVSNQTTSAKRYVSETIFENVRVLAIDQMFSNSGTGGPAVIGSTATFEMTQFDAEILQQSVAQGDLSLTLRPMGRSRTPGKSHASVRNNSNDVSSVTIYKDGQPTQLAIRGQ